MIDDLIIMTVMDNKFKRLETAFYKNYFLYIRYKVKRRV